MLKPFVKKGNFYEGLDKATGVIAHEPTPTDETTFMGLEADDASPDGEGTPSWLIIMIVIIVVVVILSS